MEMHCDSANTKANSIWDDGSEVLTVCYEDECFDDKLSPESTKKFLLSSTGLGLVFGGFLQLGMLGALFLIEVFHGADILPKYVLAGCLWAAIGSTTSITVMFLIGNLFNNTKNHDLALKFECHFMAGTVTGAYLAWTITDQALNFGEHAVDSLWILMVSLAAIRLMMSCLSPSAQTC